jgi:hypothetical protein
MCVPGYYKSNLRGLTLRELTRWYGLWRLPWMLLISRIASAPKGGYWMPGTWDETACPREALPTQFWESTARQCEGVRQLGFSEVGYGSMMSSMVLDPTVLCQGRVTYLDTTHTQSCSVFHVRKYLPPPLKKTVDTVVVSFTAYFENGVLSCINNRKTFDTTPDHTVVCTTTDDPAIAYQRFVQALRARRDQPRIFPDFDSLRACSDAELVKQFEARVRRGLYVKMTDAEVEEARRNMPPPLPV